MIYEFSPKQDLHGYDKPWAGGTNINLLDIFSATMKAPPASAYGVSSIVRTASGTVEISGIGQAGYESISMAILSASDENAAELMGKGYVVSSKNVKGGTIDYSWGFRTDTENQYAISYIHLTPGVPYKISFDPMVSAESAASFSPYANICPPEGYNIWDPTAEEMIQVYAGYVNANTRELYLRPVYKEYAGEELVGPWMSSLDPYEEDTTPTVGAFVIDFGGELTSYEITPFMLQTLLDSLGIRQHFTDGAGLLNKLMDQAQGRVRSEEELLHLSRPLNVIAIGDQLPVGLTFKPISKDVLPGLPGKFIR